MPGLFDPIQIKGLTLKNRLVMPPMANGFGAEDGAAGDKHIAHYTARAKGGVGLIIIEHTFVSKEGKASKGQLGLGDDKLIPGLKKLVDHCVLCRCPHLMLGGTGDPKLVGPYYKVVAECCEYAAGKGYGRLTLFKWCGRKLKSVKPLHQLEDLATNLLCLSVHSARTFRTIGRWPATPDRA